MTYRDEVLKVLQAVLAGEEYGHAKAAVAIAMQRIAAIPEPSAEPVAWEYTRKDGRGLFPSNQPPDRVLNVEAYTYRPLYAAPPSDREDAERYRWLRGGPDLPPHSKRWPRWEVRHWTGGYWDTLFADALDAAIDAARKREGT